MLLVESAIGNGLEPLALFVLFGLAEGVFDGALIKWIASLCDSLLLCRRRPRSFHAEEVMDAVREAASTTGYHVITTPARAARHTAASRITQLVAANRTQRRSASLRPPLRAEAADARGASLMTWRHNPATPQLYQRQRSRSSV